MLLIEMMEEREPRAPGVVGGTHGPPCVSVFRKSASRFSAAVIPSSSVAGFRLSLGTRQLAELSTVTDSSDLAAYAILGWFRVPSSPLANSNVWGYVPTRTCGGYVHMGS